MGLILLKVHSVFRDKRNYSRIKSGICYIPQSFLAICLILPQKKHGLTIHVFNTGFLAVSPNPWRFVAVEGLALQKLIGLCFSILEEHFSFHFSSSLSLIKLPGFFPSLFLS